MEKISFALLRQSLAGKYDLKSTRVEVYISPKMDKAFIISNSSPRTKELPKNSRQKYGRWGLFVHICKKPEWSILNGKDHWEGAYDLHYQVFKFVMLETGYMEVNAWSFVKQHFLIWAPCQNKWV